MPLVVSFAALFALVVLLQLSAGALAPLDAISGIGLGFTTAEIGLMGSAHFAGFLAGCWWAPRLMGQIGHSRAFAAFTACGAIGILAHMLWIGPWPWAGMRVLSGLSIAGCYTVVEAWLQAKVSNETRGRTTGIYRVADIGASLGAQLLVGVLPPASHVSYTILAIGCCAALLPLTLTRATQPEMPAAPRLRPSLAWARSPLAAVAVVIAGLVTGAIRMVGPVYGVEVGLSTDQIALFLAVFVLGGALAQYPVGWIADRRDRRSVMIWISVAAIWASGAALWAAGQGPAAVIWAALAIGFTTFPIYSLAAAHAHDFADATERVELSAALMFLYAVGAIASPLLASLMIEAFGSAALPVFVLSAHLALIAFGILRSRVRRDGPPRTRYISAPRTSFLVGRLLGAARDEDRRAPRDP